MFKRSLLLLSLATIGVQALQGTCHSCNGGACARKAAGLKVRKSVCKPCVRRRVCHSCHCSGGVCMRRAHAKHVLAKVVAKNVAHRPCVRRRACHSGHCAGGVCRRPVAKPVKARKPVRRCQGGSCSR